MEIILADRCEALTGSLGAGYGYFIKRHRSDKRGTYRFFSQRSKHLPIPRDGHLRFILACADLARMRFHIKDIRVARSELQDALREAGYATALYAVTKYGEDFPEVFDAEDIREFNINYGLSIL